MLAPEGLPRGGSSPQACSVALLPLGLHPSHTPGNPSSVWTSALSCARLPAIGVVDPGCRAAPGPGQSRLWPKPRHRRPFWWPGVPLVSTGGTGRRWAQGGLRSRVPPPPARPCRSGPAGAEPGGGRRSDPALLLQTASGNVEAKVVCFYRRRDISSSLVALADKHASECRPARPPEVTGCARLGALLASVP